MTLALYGLLALVVGGALFLLAACLLPAGEQIAPPIRDEPVWELPADRRLYPVDVAAVRLPVALRGYRFRETDQLLDRLADELRGRDEEIAMLRGYRPADVALDPSEGATGPEASDLGAGERDAERPEAGAADVLAQVTTPEAGAPDDAAEPAPHAVDEHAVDAPRTSADAGDR